MSIIVKSLIPTTGPAFIRYALCSSIRRGVVRCSIRYTLKLEVTLLQLCRARNKSLRTWYPLDQEAPAPQHGAANAYWSHSTESPQDGGDAHVCF